MSVSWLPSDPIPSVLVLLLLLLLLQPLPPSAPRLPLDEGESGGLANPLGSGDLEREDRLREPT